MLGLNKPEPYIAPYSDIPLTRKELDRRERQYRRLRQIGVYSILDEDVEIDNPYRIQAMIIINRDENVPEELIEKIKQFDKEYNIKVEYSD